MTPITPMTPAGRDVEAERFKLVRDDPSGPRFHEAEFGIPVDVLEDRDQTVRVAADGG
ncbi:hypothetical protein [Acuticoccus sp.]|uniref:hypothetical protein n=1 Tax=Acuticoccus sp. TaxID=1904378 RepID=UPI003B517C56